MTQTVMPTLARALFETIRNHVEAEARHIGYVHDEFLSGPTSPPTAVPCIPVTVASQIIEKHLTEILSETPCEPYFVEATQ